MMAGKKFTDPLSPKFLSIEADNQIRVRLISF